MSYFSRQNLRIIPGPYHTLKAYNPDQPRVPAGEPGGGQFASEGGGGGGGGGSIRHVPVSHGKGSYGVERIEESEGKGNRSRGAIDKRFESMEAAREHARGLDSPPKPKATVQHNPISYGKGSYGVERVEQHESGGGRARGRLPEEFGSMHEARLHADIMNKRGGKPSFGKLSTTPDSVKGLRGISSFAPDRAQDAADAKRWKNISRR